MNKEDKRVRRTRSRLAAALIDLSIAEGYDAVTIQAITDRAGINYRTFFRHYDSKDELLHDVLETTLADLRQVLQMPTDGDFRDSEFETLARRNGRLLFEFVGSNKELFIVFMQSGPAAFNSIQAFARTNSEEIIAALPEKSLPKGLVADHMVSSIFSFIQWWLDNGMAQTPQQMGDYSALLIMMPIRQLLIEDLQD